MQAGSPRLLPRGIGRRAEPLSSGERWLGRPRRTPTLFRGSAHLPKSPHLLSCNRLPRPRAPLTVVQEGHPSSARGDPGLPCRVFFGQSSRNIGPQKLPWGGYFGISLPSHFFFKSSAPGQREAASVQPPLLPPQRGPSQNVPLSSDLAGRAGSFPRGKKQHAETLPNLPRRKRPHHDRPTAEVQGLGGGAGGDSCLHPHNSPIRVEQLGSYGPQPCRPRPRCPPLWMFSSGRQLLSPGS